MITIKDIMTDEVIVLDPNDTLAKAQKLMTEKGIRHIPIVENDKLVGIISERDVLKASISSLAAANQDLHASFAEDVKLSEIMITNVKVAHLNDSLRSAGLVLQKNKFGCLPILEGESLVGIITDADFVGAAINLIEQLEHTAGYEEDFE